MRSLIARLVALAALALALPGATLAHTRSETFTAWQIQGSTVRMQFTITDLESKRLAERGQSLPTLEKLAGYIAPRVGANAGGKACTPVQKGDPVKASPEFKRFEFVFQCPGDKDIEVYSHAFFDMVPTHTNFAQVETADGKFFEQLLTKDRQVLPVTGAAAENELAKANFFDYVGMGIMHIFTGIDHMSFLVGLVLISRRLKDLTFVITGFTIGHSITLALAITGVLRPHAQFIDALVALTIALIGAENIAVATRKPEIVALGTAGLLLAMTALKLAGVGALPVLLLFGAALFTSNYLMISGHLRDAGRLRLVVTVVFGLIHGFGFAANLLEEKLPQSRLFELLFGFNLGVEVGQLTLVVGLSLLVYLLSKAKLTLPRPIVVDVAASGLVCAGMYWFIQRSF